MVDQAVEIHISRYFLMSGRSEKTTASQRMAKIRNRQRKRFQAPVRMTAQISRIAPSVKNASNP